MSEEVPEAETGDESKEKLSQIRYNFTRSKNILNELEGYYKKFDEIRAKLDDEDDGLEANEQWSKAKHAEIAQLVTDATSKLSELETVKASATSLIQSIQTDYDTFEPLSAKITDPSSGLQAIYTSASNYLEKIKNALASAQADYASAQTTLTDIESKSTEIETAYDEFVELKEKIDDPEDGIEAQYNTIKKFAKDAAQAKNSAESELASVISLKGTASENLEAIQEAKQQTETLQKESATLTEDIRNNLDLSTTDSLSSAITSQRRRFDKSVLLWGIATAGTVLLLAGVLGYIYYTLFVAEGKTNVLKQEIDAWMILVTVVSKAVFTSPIIFALYFTTSNFSRVRELRDKYISKEIAAKNLQAYTKLLKSQFPEAKVQRLTFTLKNMQAIYNDPTLDKKKHRFNINIGKIVQLEVQEEDVQQIESKVLEGIEDLEEEAKEQQPA